MKTMATKLIVLLAFVLAVGSYSCDSGSSSDDDDDDKPKAVKPTEQEINNNRAYVLIKTFIDVYNMHLAGKSTGHYTLRDIDCPNGGKLDMVGSTSYDNTHGITSVDLTYTFKNCMNSTVYGAVNIANGQIHDKGSWNGVDFKQQSWLGTISFSFDDLSVTKDGKTYYYDSTHPDCNVGLSQSRTGPDAWSTEGKLCGSAILY